MIPRTLWTIWINPSAPPPDLVQVMNTHHLEGYESHSITLQNWKEYVDPVEYVTDAINAQRYVKAADYLRIALLYKHGGIYLDADVALLKPFTEEMLSHRLFLGVEKERMLSNAVIGAEAGHPLLRKYLDRVDANFKGSGDLVYEAGNGIWHNIMLATDQQINGVRIYEPDFFFPYSKISGTTEITDNTICNHLFRNSWV